MQQARVWPAFSYFRLIRRERETLWWYQSHQKFFSPKPATSGSAALVYYGRLPSEAICITKQGFRRRVGVGILAMQ